LARAKTTTQSRIRRPQPARLLCSSLGRSRPRRLLQRSPRSSHHPPSWLLGASLRPSAQQDNPSRSIPGRQQAMPRRLSMQPRSFSSRATTTDPDGTDPTPSRRRPAATHRLSNRIDWPIPALPSLDQSPATSDADAVRFLRL